MEVTMSEEAGLVDYFRRMHRECDALWVEVETSTEGGDAAAVTAAFRRFDSSMRAHLGMEEEILFPAFEAATGMTGGPTQVMRMEHQQMRGVLDQMGAASSRGDHRELLDQGDTLLMLIQQHNQKEEGMLYPMSERALGAEWGEIRKRLEAWASGD
jgi:iron-sulfur cluster repair protein YtfE (RIC family)